MRNQWALPASVFAWGSAVSFLQVATLRLTFPPLADRPQAAKVAAFWQKLELSRFSLDLKTAMLACGTLLALILYPLGK